MECNCNIGKERVDDHKSEGVRIGQCITEGSLKVPFEIKETQ